VIVRIVALGDRPEAASANDSLRSASLNARSLDRVLVIVATSMPRQALLAIGEDDAVALVRVRAAGGDRLERATRFLRQGGSSDLG